MSGVTDRLLAGAQRAARGDAQTFRTLADELRARHRMALEGLVDPEPLAQVQEQIERHLREFQELCHAVTVLGEASPRTLDAIVSLGERMSIHLMAARLQHIGLGAAAIEASELIVTDDHFGAANPQYPDETRDRTQQRLCPMLREGATPVVTGFIGATRRGAITTLGRGGSDYSAAILGAALDADEVWIWTDVDGVMTADPRVAPDARTLPQLSFREVSELAFYGAKVLHPKTIRPVLERGIALWIKNTFNPTARGTLIVPDNAHANGMIKAVTAIKGQSLITIEGRGMLGVPGVAARAFGSVARLGVSVTLITQASSEQSICFSVPSASATPVKTALETEFQIELAQRDIDRITQFDEAVIVTVVGAGIKHTPGIAGKVFSALGDAHVNIVAIAQGSTDCSTSLVVDAEEADRAVRAIHQLITNGTQMHADERT
jgi:aspartate kinase